MADSGLFSHQLTKITETDCSGEILQALRAIQGAGYHPIRIVRWNASRIAFAFTAAVDIPTGGTVGNVDIRPKEPILVVFDSTGYPFTPPSAYSDRVDFPVEHLPHINPTTKAIPAYLCLHRGNLADWFAEHTILDFVARVRAWLRDAASGRLIREEDGFEPTRIVQSLGICVYDDNKFSAYVQEQWKATTGASGISFVASDLLRDFSRDPTKDVGFAVALKTPLHDVPSDLARKAQQLHAHLSEIAPTLDRIVFGILVWPIPEPVTKYFGAIPGEFRTLVDFAKELHIPLEEAIRAYQEKDLQLIGGIPVTIAIPRPQKVLGTDSAIEFLSLVILGDKENRLDDGTIAPSAPVYLLNHRRPITGAFARKLSSIAQAPAPEPRILVLGCGAQGSKLGLHLGKAGFTNIELIDHGNISPHNLIRHALLASSLGKNKAEALRDELNTLYYADTGKNFSAKKTDALHVMRDHEALQRLDLLVDATASASVLEIIVQSNVPHHTRVIRCELTDSGQLGILLMEGRGRNPRLDDLQAALFDLAIEDDRLAAWLKHHQEESSLRRGPALEEIGIGISCSSETMRLADDVVSYHSSLFSIAIRDAICNPSLEGTIHLNSVIQAPLRAMSWSVRFREIIPMGTKDSQWRIRLSSRAFIDLKSAHKAAGKNETGGLLVGFAHRKRKTIYVTRILPPSPDSEGSPYAFKRGVQDYPETLDRIHLLTGNMLGYVGEWHTHPKGAPRASVTDLVALASISSTLSAAGLPAHILIVSPLGVSSFLAEPHELNKKVQ
ncbi:MAG: ThiF family adenylyltransferase [Acidobacteriia bacterium]|nr:ThiF family adenylyltransferase [Terriglobia bacterium]